MGVWKRNLGVQEYKYIKCTKAKLRDEPTLPYSHTCLSIIFAGS
jgi:hypothetical protein